MLEKAFEKQTKTIKYQGDKQVEGIKKYGKQLALYNTLKYVYDTEKDIPWFKKKKKLLVKDMIKH